MTIEEAIEELNEEFEIFKNGISSTDWENPNKELKKIIEANTMAIKALEQQHCEDCVKREDVKSGMIKYGFLAPDMTVTEFVADLPFVTPKAEWIPVSERLPEESTNGDVIKAVFPNVEVKERNNGYEVYFGVGTAIQFFNHKWWNTPYKAESEVNADEN